MLRKILKILLWTLGIIVLLLTVLYILLQTSTFQTWISQKIGNYLGEELHTEIRVGGVDIEWFSKLVLKDLYVEDQSGEELLKFTELKVSGV